MSESGIKIKLLEPHPEQIKFVHSDAKRIIVRAGRRSGKTVGLAIRAVERFLKGRRQLYAAPTSEQTDAFWYEVCRSLIEPVNAKVLVKNESERFIEVQGTKQRIKAKTAWNADTLRGDYADDLYLDEWQLMSEDAWEQVGAPMLLDNNGDAVFSYTPPSLRMAGISKAKDPRHASKMFKDKQDDPRWLCLHFTSHDNPVITHEALEEITRDMSQKSYRQEIMAEDDEIEISWLVYGKFNEPLMKIKRFDIPKNWPVYSGHDFGSANPAALFLARNPGPDEPRTSGRGQIRQGDFVIFREYCPGSASTFEHVQNFKDMTTGYEVKRSVGGNVTTEEEIRQSYTSHSWQIVVPMITRVNAQIDRTIALMELNRIHIFDDLWMVLSEIANCMWKLDDENKPMNIIKDESKYHLLACLRYIASDFTPETIPQQEGPQVWKY